MKLFLLRTVVAVIMLLAVYCTQPTAGGGGSEVEVVGCVYVNGNGPAPATQVKLIPHDYDPSTMAAIADPMIDTSDSEGRYSFRNVAPGIYNIQAIQLKQRTRMLVTGLDVDSGTTMAPPETLQEPGAIRLLLLASTAHNGYALIPGTDIAVFVAVGSKEIKLDSVPAGELPEVRFKALDDTVSISSRNVKVKPAETTTLIDPSWQHQKSLCLNTSPAGAGVAGDVYGFPVLVRLNSGNFDFAQAQAAGGDLLFVDRNARILPYEIERWDASADSAEVWVKVDTLRGNDSTQSIIMYWGNPDAAGVSNGTAVFDTAAGFQGVWHLGEEGNNTALDATANRFDGTAYNMVEDGIISGAIGNAHGFHGDSSYIVMANTASGRLNFSEDGYYTLSAWVRADEFDGKFRTIASKGFHQYFLQVSCMPAPGPLWQFATFEDTSIWNMSHTPPSEDQWVLLNGVKHGTEQDLYCNGELVVKSGATSKTYDQKELSDMTIFRDTSDDFTIGRFFKEADFPITGYCYFKGMIDEVRICSAARSADWIKLCYMNQRSDDKLVQFK